MSSVANSLSTLMFVTFLYVYSILSITACCSCVYGIISSVANSYSIITGIPSSSRCDNNALNSSVLDDSPLEIYNLSAALLFVIPTLYFISVIVG